MAEGTILINTAVDDKQAVKDLEKLNREIKRMEQKISDKQALKLKLQPDFDDLTVQLDKASEKLNAMQNGAYTTDQIKRQEETVRALQARWDDVQKKVADCNRSIESTTADLESAKERAGALTENMVGSAEATRGLASATAAADARMEKFVNRIKGLARRVFIFSVITAALRSMRRWMSGLVTSNDEAAAALARLKGALLTLVQPLVSVIIPVLITLINLLTRIVTVVAQIVSKIFGKSIGQTTAAAKAMNAEQKAIEGVGSAAKETAKNLSGLDEFNTWDDGASGGGGGGGAEGIAPDFDLAGMTVAEDRLKDILGLVKAIGLALLTWKLSSMFGLSLGQSIALFAALYGAVEFVKGLFDAWANGASGENVRQMLLGLTAAAVGLGIAFGPVAAGIALIVGGLAMLVTGFRDAMKNGFNLHNTLLALAGIIATGLGCW